MSRPLLIPFALLAAWVGLSYALGAPVRTSTPSFASARGLASMETWGLLFLVGAVVLVAAAFVNDGRLARVALFIGGVIYLWWGALFGLTVFHDPRASLVAPALYGFLAFVHFLAANPDALIRALRRKARP